MSAESLKTSMRAVLDPLVGWLVALEVSPGAITGVGLSLSAVAGLILAAGGFLAGGVVLLLSGLCDVLDGMVARASGGGDKFGAVVDSSADRYSESFVLGGLLYYYGAGDGSRGAAGPAVSAYVVFAALIGSYMVSYVRARAEGVDLECKVGLMERPERLTVLIVGTLLGPTVMTVLLWPLALLANMTALHRLLAARGQVRGEGRRPPPAERGSAAEGSCNSAAGGPLDSAGGVESPVARPAGRQSERSPAGSVSMSEGVEAEGGLFITLEGVEGSGKSTQAGKLADFLMRRGYRTLSTREPGGTETGESIRRLLLKSDDGSVGRETELLLYMADRAQHVRDVIRPALESGSIVVCDRFSDATLAYQAGGRGLPEDTVSDLNILATGGLKPHLTILLDLPEDEGLSRAQGRGGGFDRMEREERSFHRDVRNAYLEIARREPGRVKIVDAGGTEEEVGRAVVSLVEQALERGD